MALAFPRDDISEQCWRIPRGNASISGSIRPGLTAQGLSCHSYLLELYGSVRREERLPCTCCWSRRAALVGASIWEEAERPSAQTRQMDFAAGNVSPFLRPLYQGRSIRQAMSTGKLCLSLTANQESLRRVKLSIQNPFCGSVWKN